MVIPCLCSFNVPSSPFAEPPVNKKRTRTLFRKESGSSTNCMVEQLGYIVDRDPRTIMYHENDGQHPSLNAFYQMVTMFGISVDEYFYPDMGADEAAKKRINIQLNSLNESELRLVEGIINAIIENRGTEEA